MPQCTSALIGTAVTNMFERTTSMFLAWFLVPEDILNSLSSLTCVVKLES